MAYAIGFAMAYFGPNGQLTGNVQSDLWGYEKVDDICRLFICQLLMFVMDFVGFCLNTILVWKFGRVNLMQKFCKMVNAYWIIFAIQMAIIIVPNFGLKDVNAALDMTMKFE